MNGEERIEADRAVIEAAEALVVETVKHLSQGDLLGEEASEDLLGLKPHLQGALEALEDIKGHRSLTDKEHAQHHAFKMLLTWTG
jgi:hypothetical protein